MGVLHSTIFHTILFLILALNVLDSHKNKSIKISLSFNSSDFQSVNMENALSLEDAFITTNQQTPDQKKLEDRKLEEVTANILLSDNSPIADEQYAAIFLDSNTMSTILPSDYQLSQIITHNIQKDSVQHTASQNQQNPREIIKALRGSILASGSSVANGNSEITEADFQGRLSKAGAKTGDVQISIAWNTTDDIDLHVIFENNMNLSYISWMNKQGRCGGVLDVDMNANLYCLVNKPVENIFWPSGKTPHGEFLVSVHNFRNWSGNVSTPVTVIIKVDNDIKTYRVQSMYGSQPQEVTRFKR